MRKPTTSSLSWLPPRAIQAEFDQIVLQSLVPFSQFCTGLYVVFAFAHWYTIADRPMATTMATIAATSALFFWAARTWLRSVTFPSRYGHPGATFLGWVVLFNCLAHLYLSRQAEQSTNIALVIIGGGCFFLSLPYWALFVGITLAAWFGVAHGIGESFPLQHYAFTQLSAIFVSLIVQTLRLRTHRTLIELRQRDAVRAQELENALEQANLSRRQTQLVIDNAFDAVLTLDRSGNILDCNEPAERLLGLPAGELTGQSIVDSVIAPEDRPAVRNHFREIRAAAGELAEKRLFESVVLRGDGKRFPVEVSLSETSGDGDVAATCCLRDISERRKALVAIEQASRAKSAFLATMSHELRTPLNAIIGYSEMVAEDLRDSGVVKAASDLDRIHTSGKHLLALVNDILDLSKIEAGRMVLLPEPFDPAPRIREIAETVEPIARKNGTVVAIECAEDLGVVTTDPLRFSQSLLNLASNACKFTRDGTVTIRCKRESRVEAGAAADWILIDVEDTGIGLSQDEISRLFEPYIQAGSSGRFGRAAGTGLGLVISRRFCRMMGGDIQVSSEPGKGSCFRIELPAVYVQGSSDILNLAQAIES